MLLCLREPPVRFLWCCCSSFLIFICRCFFVLLLFFIHIFFSHVISHPSVDYLLPGFYTHFIFSAQPIAEWFAAFSFSTIRSSSCRERNSLEWAFFTHRRFFTLRSFIDILHAFIMASLAAGSPFLKFAGLHTDDRLNSQTRSICLFDSE